MAEPPAKVILGVLRTMAAAARPRSARMSARRGADSIRRDTIADSRATGIEGYLSQMLSALSQCRCYNLPGWLFLPGRWLLPGCSAGRAGCFAGWYWLLFDNSQPMDKRM